MFDIYGKKNEHIFIIIFLHIYVFPGYLQQNVWNSTRTGYE